MSGLYGNKFTGGFAPRPEQHPKAFGLAVMGVAIVFAALLLFTLAGGVAKGADQPSPVPFNSIGFHEGKLTTIVTQQSETLYGGVSDRVKDVSVKATAERKLYLNGKPATDTEVEAWASKTVDCQVTVTDDRLDFSGGSPAYAVIGGPVQSAASSCPNGRCNIAPQVVYPQYRFGVPQNCPNGKCPLPR